MESFRYGVLDKGVLYFMEEEHLRSCPIRHVPQTLGRLWEIANHYGISHLYLMPGVIPVSKEFYEVSSEEYNVYFKREDTDNPLSRPTFARIAKVGIKGSRVLVGLLLDEWEWVVGGGVELLGTLHYLTKAVELPVEWGVPHMMIELLKKANSAHPHWLQEPSFNLFDLPLLDAGKDIAWKRAKLEDQLVGWHIHRYDRNSSYLGAMTNLMCGEGDPEHIVGGVIDPSVPGFYRVSYEVGASIFNGEKAPLIFPSPWVSGDLVKFGLHQGYTVQIHEGWHWKKAHKTLAKFGRALWEARQQLHPTRGDSSRYRNIVCRENAYYTIKSIGTRLGRLASRHYTTFNRPDLYALVVSRAREAVLYRIAQYAQEGYFPIMAVTDSTYYISQEKDPGKAIPGILEKERSLGGLKVEGTTVLDKELVQKFNCSKAGAMVTYLKRRGC